MTLKLAYDYLYKNLAQTDVAEKSAELRLIFEKILKANLTELYTQSDRSISEDNEAALTEIVKRRSYDEPLAYILGTRDFYGIDFYVSSKVLIPRPETEHVVDEALNFIRNQRALQKSQPPQSLSTISILDMGCGSGCIGQAILKNSAQTELLAVDVSEEAIQVAKTNASRLNLGERVQFAHVNLSDEATAQILWERRDKNSGHRQQGFDVVVANPPYIDRNDDNVDLSVSKYEPHLALYANDNGLKCVRDWSRLLPNLMNGQGIAIFEIGRDQGQAAKEIFESLQFFSNIQIKKDYSGNDRIIVAQK